MRQTMENGTEMSQFEKTQLRMALEKENKRQKDAMRGVTLAQVVALALLVGLVVLAYIMR